MGGTRRIVLVSLHVPEPAPDNAGVQYVDWLCEALHGASVAIIAPMAPANQQAMGRAYGSERLLISPDLPRSGLRLWLSTIMSRMAPVAPPVGFIRALIRNPRARSLLREADVVDLQWPVMAPLVPLMRRLAPKARVIATLHDVVSQRYSREVRQRRLLRARVRAAVNYLHARVIENAVGKRADTIVVFSDKDRQLLRSSARVTVVHPPIAANVDSVSPPDAVPLVGPPTAVLIGPLTRRENLDAARWFVESIWPLVRRAVPDARLLIVGRAEPKHHPPLSGSPGVEVVGFVDDLDGVYAGASVVVAPLRFGAGVKFKVVDALARGTPVVATTVAAEGIGDTAFQLARHDNATDFADAVVSAMLNAGDEHERAAEGAIWARSRYGRARFERQVVGLYGLSDEVLDETPSVPVSGVSVVIPVRNGESGIATQLEALAAQDEAQRIEVIISDNGSTDRTFEIAQAFRSCFQSLRVVDSGDKEGANHARNIGAAYARGSKILFLDSDDEISLGYIAAMTAALETSDIVGGMAVIADNYSAPIVSRSLGPLATIYDFLPYPLGCAMGMRRVVIETLAGFDESFNGGHEEVEFAWRAQQAGFSVNGAPDAVVMYSQRTTARTAIHQRRRYASTAILLWTRFSAATPGLSPISFRAALRRLASSLARLGEHSIRKSVNMNDFLDLGWCIGTVEGHIKYRFLRRAVNAEVCTPRIALNRDMRIMECNDYADEPRPRRPFR